MLGERENRLGSGKKGMMTCLGQSQRSEQRTCYLNWTLKAKRGVTGKQEKGTGESEDSGREVREERSSWMGRKAH